MKFFWIKNTIDLTNLNNKLKLISSIKTEKYIMIEVSLNPNILRKNRSNKLFKLEDLDEAIEYAQNIYNELYLK